MVFNLYIKEANLYRDKVSSLMLELERKEKEMEAIEDEQAEEIARLNDEWQASLDEIISSRQEIQEVSFFF